MITYLAAYLIVLYLSVATYLLFGFSLDLIPFMVNLDFTDHEKLQKLYYLAWPISFPISFCILSALIIGLLIIVMTLAGMSVLLFIGDLLFPPSRASLAS